MEGGADPTYAMLDQLLRILLLEGLRALVWAVIFTGFYKLFGRK